MSEWTCQKCGKDCRENADFCLSCAMGKRELKSAPGSALAEKCAAFMVAWDTLEAATHALSDAVQPDLLACKTIDDYYELIDKLPKQYRGVRRIYEAIERMSDKQSES